MGGIYVCNINAVLEFGCGQRFFWPFGRGQTAKTAKIKFWPKVLVLIEKELGFGCGQKIFLAIWLRPNGQTGNGQAWPNGQH